MNKITRSLAVAAIAALALAGCSSNDPLDNGSSAAPGSDAPIVVGSQGYYSNEIIAEVYSQALEADGFKVDRQFRIGQREVYLPEIVAGKIDLFPEYSGPLLQFWEPDTEARLPDDVYAALEKATPQGLRVLDQAPATDQDSYVVTKAFAEKWNLKSIEDLAKVTDKLVLGANSEAESRPNGPKGMKGAYGLDVGFTPIEDSGGPLTVKALKDNSINLAIIYTADPSIKANDLVALTDTKGLFLSSNVVPLASAKITDQAAATINKVSAALTSEALIGMNAESVEKQLPAAKIAEAWLTEQKLN